MSTNNEPSASTTDDCSICLRVLGLGSALLTLSCGHKFHFRCLTSNIKAKNEGCPLCRAPIDASLISMLNGNNQTHVQQSSSQQLDNIPPLPPPPPIQSVEDQIDETVARGLSARITSARQAALSSYSARTLPLINVQTALEYRGQPSHKQSNIYGLVTLKAPSSILSSDNECLTSSRVPIDLVCVVDQSGSMAGNKLALLKETLIYIAEQLNQLDRLAIISFHTSAFNRSHGLKRMNQENQNLLKHSIENINARGGTFIGSGLQMGIEILNSRQTKNPLGVLFLLTDGQDNETHDYSQLMQTLPNGIQCHTFGYGSDHIPTLLVQIAEQGHGGTFTYIDEQEAVGPAFAMALGGLFSCVAQKIQVNIQFNGEYKVTNIHSKYPYEPIQLPSSQVIIKLNDLNTDENRNLVFQLHVPNVGDQENVKVNSLETTSQRQSENNQHVIGRVSIRYVEPNSNQELVTESVPFHLIRVAQPSNDLLQVNYTLDLQRNRVETAHVLKLAMDEHDYQRSLNFLKNQVEKILASVSANDPFCRNLIKDLRHSYLTEREYRLASCNQYAQHRTERGTYFPSSTASTIQYQNISQRCQAAHYMSKRS